MERAPGPGRLLRRSEFLAVAGARRKWVAPGLILQIRRHDDRQRPAAGEPSVRVGFTASRKVGGAVERNRARRRLRAAVREVVPALAAPGYDIVVIARAQTLSRGFDDLRQDLVTGLRRLGAARGEGEAR
jgi:ribonuclease P protein component